MKSELHVRAGQSLSYVKVASLISTKTKVKLSFALANHAFNHTYASLLNFYVDKYPKNREFLEKGSVGLSNCYNCHLKSSTFS